MVSLAMSWVKSLAAGNEDVFDEDADDTSLQNKEWKQNMDKRVKDGYRDGVDAGKEETLQSGFNEGFRQGAIRMKAIGQLKGIVSALQCWCQRPPVESSATACISSLMQDVVQHEEAVLEAMKRAQERPVPTVGDVAEGMEDLEMAVDQGPAQALSEPPQALGCGKSDCCRTDTHCSEGQSSCSSAAVVSLEELAIRCAELVTQLGLPEEFVYHVQQLKTHGL
ncbi:hypothetical protein ACEWY4_018934 [Coilia grayii]|uniref:Essential protein Yae1 N-terminal domain-containing protein n=1 Tax=Coilia grayii TaxID=363190 RepID=A0ABD1JFU7_9TELE